MSTRAVATPPGQPTLHVELTAAEDTARAIEEAEHLEVELRLGLPLQFKREALARIAAQVPAWDSFERIEFLLSIANLLNTANMNAAQTLAKDILVFTRDVAIPKIAGLTVPQLQAIDVAADDPFGDGTLWPV